MEHNQNISALLSDLLHHYDCVIVPELGGFVTDYRSARIDKELHIIHPPSKDLRFNAQLKKNDGLLANALSQAKSITHEEANTRIKAEVDDYFTSLDQGKSVRFEKVGILYLDSQKNVQFRAEDSVNYLLDSFRLKKVYARPLAEVEPIEIPAPAAISEPIVEVIAPAEVKAPEPIAPVHEINPEKVSTPVMAKEPEQESAPVVPISESSSGRRWMAAALIPLLFYLGFVAVRSDVVRDGSIQVSDLNPFKAVHDTQQYAPRTETFDLTVELIPAVERAIEESTDNPDWNKLKEEFDAEKALPAEVVISSPAVNTYVASRALANLEFHVIGGCFGELENAEGMVDKLRKKGYEAYIMDYHKGLHRVTYGNYTTREEALLKLSAIKEGEQADAWLLRKK